MGLTKKRLVSEQNHLFLCASHTACLCLAFLRSWL
jgi:hypothetical protein